MTGHEKRKQTRLPLEVRVQLLRGDSMSTHLCGDVSAGGLFVRTDESWRNGERVSVRVFLPGLAGPLLLDGEVVRVTTGQLPGIGVRFLEQNRELARFCESRSSDVLQRHGKQILIAHAKEDMRYFLRSVLAVEGYRVQMCGTLEEARAALAREKFDLLVGDPLLGDDEGATLGEWLQLSRFKGHVIMVTEGEVVGEAPYSGGDFALVSEPVELSSFRKLVWNLVR